MKRLIRSWRRFAAECARSAALERLEREREVRREALTAIREGCR
jgi:hypothetical protein